MKCVIHEAGRCGNDTLFLSGDTLELARATSLLFFGLMYLWLCAGAARGQQEQHGGISAKTCRALKHIGSNRAGRRLTGSSRSKFAEVEIAVGQEFDIEYISDLPRAPGSKVEIMDNPNRVRVQVPASEVEALADKGAEITVLREFILAEGFAAGSDGGDGDASSMAGSSGPYGYGENPTNVSIPDTYPAEWTYSEISISSAPAGSTVTSIDVHYEIVHTYVGDLIVDLSDQGVTYEYNLWNDPYNSGRNLNKTETGITVFNGEMVNQWWLLWAVDTLPFFDEGYIDSWWIKVYYEGITYEPYFIQADSYFENTVEVPFSFGSNPGRVQFSVSPGCGSLNPTYDDPEYDSGYWWVSTTYNPCEAECSSVTLTADPTYGSDQTREVHLDDRYHTGCGLQEELGVPTYDPERDEPAQAHVSCTVVPPEAGTCEPSSGDSQYNPLFGLYEFWCTYTPDCSYTGRVRVKFVTDHPGSFEDEIFVFSFDQNENVTPSSNWQTVSESFCAEGWYMNYYQVYKMHLCADASYDFSLCGDDGVGASCDGYGDFDMFDSSGALVWYVDGERRCDYAASTLRTDYEGWSPPSDGYYYLKVSEYYFEPMNYTLAYRGGTLGDFDSNCRVDFPDFAILGNQWLQEPGSPPADIAPEVPDGVVNMRDLAVLVENWLDGVD